MPPLPVRRAQAILAGIGAPVTPGGVAILVAWQACEGGPASRHNPMNTTLPLPGSVPINAQGVQQYPTEAEGIAATVQTLQNGLYPGIVAALRSGSPAQFLSAQDEIQTWGTNPQCIAQRLGMPLPGGGGPLGGIERAVGKVPRWVAIIVVGVPLTALILDDLRRL